MIEPIALEVREIKRNHFGLFTLQRVSQGTTILWLPANRVLPEPDQWSLYIKDLDLHIDCKGYQAGEIRHSCQPNSVIRGTRVVAWECLEPGDEVTLDYTKTESKITVPFICDCCGVLIQ